MFSKSEQKFIKSRIKIQGIADKVTGVSREYVSMILRGERDIKSEKAQTIIVEFQKVLEELYIKEATPVFAVVKNGYADKNEVVIEDKTEVRFGSLNAATAFLLKKKTPKDYYITQQEFDGLYWVSIEGTEMNI